MNNDKLLRFELNFLIWIMIVLRFDDGVSLYNKFSWVFIVISRVGEW